MQTTQLELSDKLPLTCSRSGTCCHGNLVRLNPWELFRLAKEKNRPIREFRDLHTDFGGIQLRFDGKSEWQGQKSCSLYLENFGCSAHQGRPLACRLFPLGRQIQKNEVNYIYQGEKFPCLNGCPEVEELPILSVREYLNGQETDQFETAQDEYLELMQNIADMAFELLLDTGLAESKDTQTLTLWREMGNESPEALFKRIDKEWLDCLTLPDISNDFMDPKLFVKRHGELLQSKIQEDFGALQNNQEFHEASVELMGLAFHLARSIGANPAALADLWCETAKQHGALESE